MPQAAQETAIDTPEPRRLRTKDDREALVKWYFATNGPGLRKKFDLIRVAVTSARLNTTLKPHCIYDGEDCKELKWLKKNGVKIIRHKPSFEVELRTGYQDRYESFNGHWLRADLPRIDRKSDRVLYTDIDVMFMNDPRKYLFKPRYLAVCEEHKVGQRAHFNSGVMVMNMVALRNVYPWFIRAIKQRLLSTEFSYPQHDQRSFNDFFLDEVDWMQPEFNWKPYWGYNENAVVVHFHGPKPAYVRRIWAGKTAGMKPGLITIFNRDPEGYQQYISIFEDFLTTAKGC